MSGLEMLDVAIGIIFIFLLLSLICSAINEIIEAWLKLRAVDLEQGIRELLHDPDGTGMAQKLYNHPLVYGLFRGTYEPAKITDNRYAKKSDLPSYIPARNFALALMDIVMPATGAAAISTAQPLQPLRSAIDHVDNQHVKQALLSLIDAAEGDIHKARENIEAWYNSAMDRVAGWYKRRVQTIIFFLGLFITVAVNADTIALFKSLANDPPLRSSLVAAAQEYAKTQPQGPNGSQGSPEDRVRKNMAELQKLSLPIGWDWKSSLNPHAAENYRAVPPWGWIWISKVAGWLVTAIAISLGAPFWFDVLNKVMVVRSTVKPHEKSPEEASEDKQR